jgi:hypothetical protein
MLETTTLTAEQKLKLLVAHRPWESEPDNAEWEDKLTGYKCRIQRHGHFGHLCGYVGIPKSHPLYGKHYSDDEVADIRVHGGLTHSGEDQDDKDTWWFGFDCSHAGDLSPNMLMHILDRELPNLRHFHRDEVYRTWDYVENEVRELVRQLRDEDALANQIPNLPIERN